MIKAVTAIKSHGEVDRIPRETYGRGPTILRIGNGGAGATGLIQELAEDFLTTSQQEGSIDWICNHSRNTQLALLEGVIDLALTYERDQEALAESEGWSRTAGCVFRDHFLLAGPIDDPAGITSAGNVLEAFSKIANSNTLFHSRADASATMWKERHIWEAVDMRPWDENKNQAWYKTSCHSPADALIEGDKAGAYLLTDRSTLLRQTTAATIHSTTVFFEPTSVDHLLMNNCYALTATSLPESSSQPAVIALFVQYLLSEPGQSVIANYGATENGGFPFFAPVAAAFAEKLLRGGSPQQGRWQI